MRSPSRRSSPRCSTCARRAHFWRQPGGRYRPAGPPLPLPTNVLSAEAGPSTHPVVALTDEGLSEIRLNGAEGEESLSLEPLLDEPCAFAGTGAILAGLDVLKDVDGDKVLDAVIPTPRRHRHPSGRERWVREARFVPWTAPGDERRSPLGSALRDVPIPRIEDATATVGRLDLVSGPGRKPRRGSRSLAAWAEDASPRRERSTLTASPRRRSDAAPAPKGDEAPAAIPARGGMGGRRRWRRRHRDRHARKRRHRQERHEAGQEAAHALPALPRSPRSHRSIPRRTRSSKPKDGRSAALSATASTCGSSTWMVTGAKTSSRSRSISRCSRLCEP